MNAVAQLDHFLLYGERHGTHHLFLHSGRASELIGVCLERIEERRHAIFLANTDGGFKNKWQTTTSIIANVRASFVGMSRHLIDHHAVLPDDIGYLEKSFRESEVLLREIKDKIFWYWCIRLALYFLSFLLMLFLPNLASVKQPGSDFYEVAKNIFSVVCGLLLCQFVDVVMRDKFQDCRE